MDVFLMGPLVGIVAFVLAICAGSNEQTHHGQEAIVQWAALFALVATVVTWLITGVIWLNF